MNSLFRAWVLLMVAVTALAGPFDFVKIQQL